jgi:MoaA/NifB/PqqE/SkfB family radical SAM enzyme
LLEIDRKRWGAEKMNQNPGNQPFNQFEGKLWIYTNYDCNLHCRYCVAQSSPAAPRRSIGLETVQRLVDEAVQTGFSCVFFTGGEPMLLNEIYAMLEYASQRLPTVLLTNAMLIKGKRLEKLRAVANERLVIQVSLDGGRPEHHDAYRGTGTWQAAVAGIHILQDHGFNLRISTTETPTNSPFLSEICSFHKSLGIPEEDHFIRPLARGGFSTEGIEVGLENLSPEITVNADGVYWHPLITGKELLIAPTPFPLSDAVKVVMEQMDAHQRGEKLPLKSFT